jgi:hypothetical protein
LLTESKFDEEIKSILNSENVKIKTYKPLMFPVVLYECLTWSLTLREEHRLRVFENRILRKIFRPKRDEIIGDWRKLHNKELHNLYFSPKITRLIKSRRMRWIGHVASMGENGACRVLVGKCEGTDH